jgi:hypothetical protein
VEVYPGTPVKVLIYSALGINVTFPGKASSNRASILAISGVRIMDLLPPKEGLYFIYPCTKAGRIPV